MSPPTVRPNLDYVTIISGGKQMLPPPPKNKIV
jgi:hypothetical protein